MATPSAGKVVLVPFPFSNLSSTKVRPAVILADAARGDWILCQITSKPFGDPITVAIGLDDFANGSLQIPSYARPTKLFTFSESTFRGHIGTLKPSVFATVIETVVRVLTQNHSLS